MSRVLFIVAALFVAAFSSCTNPGRVVEAQTPGRASGAGASLVGPGNSAAPSTQQSERTIEYFDDVTQRPSEPAGGSRDIAGVTEPGPVTPGASRVTDQAPRSDVASRDVPRPAGDRGVTPPRPRYVHEKVTTTIGQHQDAAPLIRAASAASGWPATRWLGWLCIFVGAGGWLYGVTHKETGYPLVFLKVAGCGVLLVLVGDNPLWLLVLGLPLAFYAAQKLGVLRPLP